MMVMPLITCRKRTHLMGDCNEQCIHDDTVHAAVLELGTAAPAPVISAQLMQAAAQKIGPMHHTSKKGAYHNGTVRDCEPCNYEEQGKQWPASLPLAIVRYKGAPLWYRTLDRKVNKVLDSIPPRWLPGFPLVLFVLALYAMLYGARPFAWAHERIKR